jgi:hypothetical protein
MKKSFCGLMHVHSRYSVDGILPLEEIRELCKRKKTDFIILAEHADGKHFTAERMGEMLRECKGLSSEEFLFIPGLEYDCEGMHILAIGVEEYFVENKLENLIDRIKERGGLAVLAHVVYYDSIPYERLVNLDGVEAWNARYDGRFSPSIKSLKILKRFRMLVGGINAFAGSDLHEKYSFGSVSSTIHLEGLNKKDVIDSLRTGMFYSSNGLIRLYPKNGPSRAKKAMFAVISIPFCILRKMRKIISRIIAKTGLKTPKGISKSIKTFFG